MILKFLTRTHNNRSWHWTDTLSYLYLFLGLFMMFAPVAWLALSSFKTPAALSEYPPSFLPQKQQTIKLAGHEEPLPVFSVQLDDGSQKTMAQVRRMGIMATMVDPAKPEEEIQVNLKARTPIKSFHLETDNYSKLFEQFNFKRYLSNSLFITIVATLLTLWFNSMAAFALSKYRFSGEKWVLLVIISTLMIPPTIILVPAFLVINHVGLFNSLWGVIIPAVATPTGVFLLRQYMLTIPDELLEAARMDHASEWRIYWRIILPLAAPALAVLAIFSIMWRWNDFLWPLIVLSRSENFTLQLALNSFQGELNTEWHYLLAMTVITVVPVTLVFAFLQKHITTGIASSGVK
ncbi:MAG: hypothetical protein RLZZ502_867 [Pseudomonadota bacterium]|jgi:alpha-1,4-digalacturonate transport system permease protein